MKVQFKENVVFSVIDLISSITYTRDINLARKIRNISKAIEISGKKIPAKLKSLIVSEAGRVAVVLDENV